MSFSPVCRFVAVSLLGIAAAGFAVRAQTQAPAQGRGGRGAAPAGAQAQNFPDYPKVDVVAGYRWVENWPQKPAEAVWAAMSGIAVDSSNNIWTLNRGNIPIQVYRPDGSLVRMWGQGGVFGNPHQVRFDKDGNVWTADNGFHTVSKFTPEGKLLLTLGTKGAAGEDNSHFNQPTDLVVSPSGDVFISDGYVNSRVVHYDKNGKFVKAWGKLGTGPGEFSLPHGIGMDSKGRLYVVDRNNGRVQVFEQSGKYVTEWRNIINPWAIWITPKDEVFVCGSTPSQWWEVQPGPTAMNGVPAKDQIVVKFDTDGRVRELWAFPLGAGTSAKPGELNWVHTLAVDAKGDLYLGDIRGRRAQKFARVEAGVAPLGASRR
jgi:streptogramin lyase